jgi:ribosomal-protein-serine acetyltransferase
VFYYEVDGEIQLKLIMPEKDSEEIYAFVDRSRNYLREWLGWVDKTTTVEHMKEYEQMMFEKFAKNEALSTAIVYKGELVGKITINSIDWDTKKAEIGYYLDEEFQGSGIMTRASKGMLDIAFTEYDLQKVEIRVAVENVKSRHIPERLGFTQEGILRQAEWINGQYKDLVVYGLLAEEWLGKE